MVLEVADIRANFNETILFAVRIIGKSRARLKVFREIYRGKKKVKAVSELSRKTGLSRIRVLQEGGKLAGHHIVGQTKLDGETAYRKDGTYSHSKHTILQILRNPRKASKYPTKQTPRGSSSTIYNVSIRTKAPRPKQVTIDDISSFKLVRRIPKPNPSLRLNRLPEMQLKKALKKIVGETHDFTDWGGEKNDLFTNKFRLHGARIAAAFALKGKATQGPLTPKKMGKNGDQIGRLLSSEAQAFFVVYHGKVDQSIFEQMQAFALGKSLSGHRVHYGVVDGDDLKRLYQAYPKEFGR